ncbi:glycosyltransferase [Candidatus Woesearchaeota archaeon]|nr:glycosyltransferase [Candidatus Woesearchaeota archaeon]
MIYILANPIHFTDPSGLGIVARESLAIGKILINPDKVSNKRILHCDNPAPLPIKNKNYIWTTWESDRIPSSWVNVLNKHYVGIFVPHRSVKKAFESSGVEIPVHVVFQGYKRLKRTRPIKRGSDRLRLGMFAGNAASRKNPGKLCKAVKSLNKEGYNIYLYIKTTSYELESFEKSIKKFKKNPYINISFEKYITDKQLAEWYSDLDAYIFPSSGEGWSLTPRESLYMGIPTIVSDIPVHKELIDSGYVTKISADEYEDAYNEWINNACGKWKKITVEEIKKAILDVYNDYDEKLGKAQQGSRWIKDKWRWSDALQKIYKVIENDKL